MNTLVGKASGISRSHRNLHCHGMAFLYKYKFKDKNQLTFYCLMLITHVLMVVQMCNGVSIPLRLAMLAVNLVNTSK